MRQINSTSFFDRKLVKFLKKNPQLEEKVEKIFHILERSVNDPLLHTHRLGGNLSGYYACSITYNYRLVFRFDEYYIYPRSIGSHDEVY